MLNNALQLTVVVLATISGFDCVNVELKPSGNYSLPCDKRWVPTCAACEDGDLTFANYCFYYTHRAQQDDDCKFRHFGVCELNCRRKICSNKKCPICARCGFQDLSFRNQCQLENFNCLYRNSCVEKEKGYCKDRHGKTIRQKFFEKSEVHSFMFTEKDIFEGRSRLLNRQKAHQRGKTPNSKRQ